MANEEQLKILEQGVEVWNQWRGEHPEEKPNLEDANLEGMNLQGINFQKTDLTGTNLSKTILIKANLHKAELIHSDLREADLSRANLMEASLEAPKLTATNLNGANLSKAKFFGYLYDADFRGVNLVGADFIEADLSGVILNGANLSGADFRDTDLERVNLRGTNLSGATFESANLKNANLEQADVRWTMFVDADLSGADLSRADLTNTYFTKATLIQTNLSHANITGAKLYGTARDDWIIDDIKCDYIYWDEIPETLNDQEEQLWELEHRVPKDRDFRPGEFEELYKHLPTFEYAFEHGITLIDIAMIDQIVSDIHTLHPDWELKIDSFHSRGQPHANFTIREKDLIAQAFQQIKTKYEETLNKLKGQYEESNRILSRFMRELTDRPQLVLNGDIIVGDKNIGRDNIEISGQAQVNQLTTGNSGTDTSSSTE